MIFAVAIPVTLLRIAIGIAPHPTVVDSARFISPRSSDSALVAIAAHDPDSLRSALTDSRVRASRAADDSARGAELAFAVRLASAYAIAWRDSFFVRQVARFAAASPAWRARWRVADSLRRAGVTAAARVSVSAALRLWHRSMREFRAIGDSAGLASATGNLGAGFYLAGDLDSATIFLERARQLASSIGDLRTEGNAIGTLASVHRDRGELREARQMYEQALALRERSGDGRGAAADRNNIGLIAQDLGDLDEARRAFLGALAENRTAGRRHSEAINLTNLATLASTIGDSPGADTLYRAALAIYSALGERDDAAIVLHDLALLQMRRADYDGALASLTRALALSDSTGAVLEHAAELGDLATLLAARGDLDGARKTIHRAEEEARRATPSGALRAELALTRGDLSAALNRLADAQRDYAEAARLASEADDRALLAEVQRGEGLLLVDREKYGEATRLLEASIRNHRAVGDARSAAVSRIALGYAQARAGDTARARRSLVAAVVEMRAVGDPVGQAAAYEALGELELESRALFAAEADFRRGLDLMHGHLGPEVAWSLHAGLGATLRARGALAEAVAELQLAIDQIERTAGRLLLADHRASYHADKWDVYAMLVLVQQQLGQPADAFATSERLRARQALELASAGTVPFTSPGDSLAAREQTLRHRIAELTRLVATDDASGTLLRGSETDAPARDAARSALAEEERAYEALRLELEAREPRTRRLAESATVSAHDVAGELRPEEALLEYLVTDSATTVFVITTDTTVAFALDVNRRELASLVDYTRDAIARAGARGTSPWRAPLRRLYGLLVQPVEEAGLLRGKKRLVVVPHGELHFLPFGALMPGGEGDHFLVERSAILTAPSATLWVLLTRRRARPSGAVLAIAPRIDILPASRSEVESVGAIYGTDATILTGAQATRTAFIARAPSSAVLHLASLGVLNKHNPLFSFVELAPSGDDDGRLAVIDVLALRLDARLVTLSACQTALGAGALADVPPGDDWVGFTSAFLRAGARDVLATLWPVEDESTARLMTRFYAAFASGANAADALAAAQREALRQPARAAPLRWAGFIVTGAR